MHYSAKESLNYITKKTHALLYTGNTCTTLHRKHVHNSTQETYAKYYTGYKSTTSHRKHMHYITQKTYAKYYTGISKLHQTENICKISRRGYTGNTCTTLHS